MALQRAPGQGNLPYKPNAFASAVSGIAGLADAYQKEKERRKKLAEDDAIRIFQLAQKDPLVLQTPQASQAFEKAGWPVPEQASNLEAPTMLRGRKTYSQWSQATGQWEPTDIETPRASANEGWDKINQLLNMRKNAELAGNQPVIDAIDTALSQIMPPATPEAEPATAPAQPANPGWLSRLFGGGKATPQVPQPTAGGVPQLGELASQWLAPNQSGAFGPRPTPTAVPSPKPVVSPPNASMQGLQSAMDEAKRRGIPVPSGRRPGNRRQAAPPAPAAKEPATQAEFEQAVKEMAKTDRKRAKAYYDKWVSKWQ